MRTIDLTIARNSMFNIGSQVVLRFLSVIFTIVIVRQLGDHDFGVYATVGALIGITAVFSDLGMAGYAVRKIAEDRGQAVGLLTNMIPLRLLLALILLVVNIFLARALGYPPETIALIALGGIGLLLYACQGPLEVMLLGFERFDYTATFSILNQAVFVATGGVFLWLGWGVSGVLVASFCGIIAGTIAALRVGRHLIAFSWQIDVRSWLPLMRAGLPFCISTFAMTVSFKVDTILLSVWRSPVEVGWYNVAYNLIFSLQTLASGFISSLMPSLSRHHRQDPESTMQFYFQAMRYLLLVGLPIAVGTSLLADRLLVFVYGDSFAPAGPVLRILIWVLPILLITSLYGSLMTVVHREGSMARVNLANAACNFLVNLWAIPRYGMVGAAAMTVVTELIGLAQFAVVLRDRISPKTVLAMLLAPGTAALAMGGVLALLWDWPLLALIPIGASVYTVALLLNGGIAFGEVKQLAMTCGVALLRQRDEPVAEASHD